MAESTNKRDATSLSDGDEKCGETVAKKQKISSRTTAKGGVKPFSNLRKHSNLFRDAQAEGTGCLLITGEQGRLDRTVSEAFDNLNKLMAEFLEERQRTQRRDPLAPCNTPLQDVASAVNSEEQKAPSYKYFHAYNSGCNGIVILRLSDKEICPVEFMSWVMERLRHERSQSFIGKKTRWHFVHRIVPLQAVCVAEKPSVIETAKKLLPQRFALEDEQLLTYGIVTSKRNNEHIDRMDLIKELARDVIGEKYKVKLKEPTLSVLVEICKSVCGLAVVRNMHNLSRFNVQRPFPTAAAENHQAAKPATDNAMLKDVNVTFVLGPPGAGKGTQCKKICANKDYIHLSAGDLLRAERNNPSSKEGSLIDNCIKEGKIVPVEITLSLIKKAMLASAPTKNFLIDGFPRNQDNLDGWNTHMKSINIQMVLVFECPKDVCMTRALGRGENRTDDNVQSYNKRYNTFLKETVPIIEYYKQQNLVRSVNSLPGVEEVFREVLKVLPL